MNLTKRTLIALGAVAATLALQPAAPAADEKDAAPGRSGDRFTALRERMQETAKELNLTAEQKEKLQALLRKQGEKLRELRQDTNLSGEEKVAKFRSVQKEIEAELKKILTPEQFEKWKAKQSGSRTAIKPPMERIQDAIQDLNLTDSQKEQLRPLYEEQMEKLRDLHLDTSLTMAEKLEKLKAIHKDVAPQLKKVMTPEQFAKWEKDINQWLAELKERFGKAKKD